ncbi:hypothetical protein H4582DRAFT_1987276 [Lactarius indigo]|nr:hypothetical protein H4582DRAFT_1987276 [Lactarius indigo]
MSTFRSSVMTCLNVSSSIPSIRAIIFRLVATSILRISVATCSVVVCSYLDASRVVIFLRGDRDTVFGGSLLSDSSRHGSFRFILIALMGVVIRSSVILHGLRLGRFPHIGHTGM